MTTTLNPVTKVSQGEYEAPIGAIDRNIYLYDNDSHYLGTLKDFHDNWLNFKENNNFTFTGYIDPHSVPQIKTWYQTYENTSVIEEEEENN